jgi:hypothetical protein
VIPILLIGLAVLFGFQNCAQPNDIDARDQASSACGQHGSQNFVATGADQQFIPPCGVITVKAWGAGGGGGGAASGNGGAGAFVTGTLIVTPGAPLTVVVGVGGVSGSVSGAGVGGYGGGGTSPGDITFACGGGGGLSGIQDSS